MNDLAVMEPEVDDKHYSPETLARAYDLYLNTCSDPAELAVELGTSVATVRKWIRDRGWRERKDEIERALMKEHDDKYRSFLREHRLPTLLRHISVATKGEAAIEKLLDDMVADDKMPDAIKLRRLGEALTSFANVSARAAGISDRPPPLSDAEEAEGKRKIPLVVVGVNVQSSSSAKEPVTIEVKDG